MTDIPVIDFKNLPFNDNLNDEELDRWKEIGEEVYKACSEYGFFYIKNHGIAREDIDAQFKISKEFFDFPSSEKNQFHIQPGVSYGYLALKQETLETEAGPDHKEAFNVWTATAEVPPQRIPPYFKKNHDNLQDFYSKCHQLSVKILRSFALGLKLEDYKFFDESNQKNLRSGTTLRYLHYPPIQNATEELVNKKIIRCGAHSDYGTITLLFQSECEGLDSDFSGLQVLHGKNNWINVGNKEGCIVVNTGDLMSIWTEGRFKSAVHRVVVPNTELAKIHRYTLAFFSHSNSDYPIYSLKTTIPAPSPVKCVTNPNTGQVEYHSTLGASPFVFGENDGVYLRRRLTATMEYKKV